MSAQPPTLDAGQSAASTPDNPADLHTFPAWFDWARDRLFMSLLIVAEMYLLATGGAEGWVPQLDNLNTWGWFHGVGVVLFFLACAATAGIALGLSMQAAYKAAAGEYGAAFFTGLGSLFFAILELVINLSERSWNLKPSPFDQWFLMVIHAPTNLPFTPTLLATALLLPATTFAYGWARTPKAKKVIRSAAEIRLENEAREAEEEARRQRKLADAEMKHREKLIRDGRLTMADLRRQEEEEARRLAALNAPDPVFNDETTTDDDPSTSDANNVTPMVPVGIPTNYWQARDAVRYANEKYDRALTADMARALIQNVKGAVQYRQVAGQPWAAPRAAVKKALDNKYQAQAVNE